MSERREGYVTPENLWANQAYDIQEQPMSSIAGMLIEALERNGKNSRNNGNNR